MNKIGVIISRVSSGATVLYSSEAAKEWEQEALDTRNCLKCIPTDDIPMVELENTFFDFVTYGTNVAFINLNKYISGRGEDLLSAMIVVPGYVDITGNELQNVIVKTKEIISEAQINNCKLSELFCVDYAAKDVCGVSQPSADMYSDSCYAFRYYGEGQKYSLEDILGNLFQPYYSSYKAVFLIDHESLILPNEDVENITKEDLIKAVVLQYPEHLPNAIEIWVNEHRFTNSLSFVKGETVHIEIRKKGFEPEYRTMDLEDDITPIDIDNIDWKKILRRQWFHVQDKETKKKLPSAKVFINEKEVNDFNKFTESELKSAKIKVLCDDYKETSFKPINLIDLNSLGLSIEKVPKTLEYSIKKGSELKNQDKLKIRIENTKFCETESPLKGYKCVGHGELEYISHKKHKPLEWAVLVITLLFALNGLLALFNRHYAINAKSDASNFSDTVAENDATRSDTTKTDTIDVQKNMIKYLQTHNTWKRNEMEKVDPSFVKLYDYVNNRDYNNIKEYWDSLLKKGKDISYWEQLMIALKKTRPSKTKYSNDGSITISSYIKKILSDSYEEESELPKNPPKVSNPKGPQTGRKHTLSDNISEFSGD